MQTNKKTYNVNQTIVACQKYFNDCQIAAIYLAGSQMRHTETVNSDVDLIVIVDPKLDNILFHQPLVSKQVTFTSNNIEYDCKVYDKVRFYNLITKCSPELIEVLQYQPIYCDNLDKDLCSFFLPKAAKPIFIKPCKSIQSFSRKYFKYTKTHPKKY